MMRTMCLGILLLSLWSCQNNSTTQGNQVAEGFEVIAHGEVVDLLPHVQADGLTVFDFYADWCAPCFKLEESLKEMKAVYGARLHVVKLDLVDWKSELAKHHEIKDLPYLMVYSSDKELVKKGPSNEVLPALMKMLNQN